MSSTTYNAPLTRHDLYSGYDTHLSDADFRWAMLTMDHAAMIRRTAFIVWNRNFQRVEYDLRTAVKRRADRIAETAAVVAEAKRQLAEKEAAEAAKVRANSRAPFFLCSDVWVEIQRFSLGNNEDWRRKFKTVLATIDSFGTLSSCYWANSVVSTFGPSVLVTGTLHRIGLRKTWKHNADNPGVFLWREKFDYIKYLTYMYPHRTPAPWSTYDLDSPGVDAKGRQIRAERWHKALPCCSETLKQRLQRHIVENGGEYKKSWSVGKLEDHILYKL